MQKITTFLWFDNNAEEAMNFYTSIFPNSHIAQISRYGEGAPMPKGTFLVGTFYLNDQEFMALNGGPNFRFTPAISLMVHCETQAEVDYYWDKLTSGGGKPGNCGWLEDKFGLSWQVVPSMLGELMSKGDAVRSGPDAAGTDEDGQARHCRPTTGVRGIGSCRNSHPVCNTS